MEKIAVLLGRLGHTDPALTIIQGIEDISLRAHGLVALAPSLSTDQQQQALIIAQNISNDYYRAEALFALLPYLSVNSVLDTLKSVDYAEGGVLTGEIIAKFAFQHEEVKHLQETFNAIRHVRYSSDQTELLITLAPFFSVQQQQEILTIIGGIRNVLYRGQFLTKLAIRLGDFGKFPVALNVAQHIENSSDRAQVMLRLVPFLSHDEAKDALRLTHTIKKSSDRAHILVKLVSRLSDDYIQEVVDISKSLEESHKSLVLEALHTQRSSDKGVDLQSDEQHHDLPKSNPQIDLTAHASSEQIQAYFHLTLALRNSGERNKALSGIALYLDEKQIQEILGVPQKFWSSSDQAFTITTIAPYLSEGLQKDALYVTKQIEVGPNQIQALSALASYLPPHHLQVALHFAESIKEDFYKNQMLRVLIPYLSSETLRQTLNRSLIIEDNHSRSQILAILVNEIDKIPFDDLPEIWQDMLLIFAKRSRSDFLFDMSIFTKLITQLGGASAIIEAVNAIHDVCRWWP